MEVTTHQQISTGFEEKNRRQDFLAMAFPTYLCDSFESVRFLYVYCSRRLVFCQALLLYFLKVYRNFFIWCNRNSESRIAAL